jgi:L-threonylcarbamoyladenylate synthase
MLTGSAPDIARAAAHIKDGGLVVFPTETVYGLGADATNDRAVAGVFSVKGRPQFNPLILHVSDADMADQIGEFTSLAATLVEEFWPGPLTVVLKRRTVAASMPVSDLACAGLDSVALRAPGHPIAHDLIKAVGRPLAAPSANRSGNLSVTRAGDLDLPDPPDGPLVIDGGTCPVGIESTIIDATGGVLSILRPGAVTVADVKRAGLPITENAMLPGATERPETPTAPGQLARHYAPDTPLRLDAREVHAGEALLAFGPQVPSGGEVTLNLSYSGDLVEAAANLFSMLHELDRGGYRMIAAMPVPNIGLGLAINDRLRRAATPADVETDIKDRGRTRGRTHAPAHGQPHRQPHGQSNGR